MDIKFDSKVTAAVGDGLAPYTVHMFNKQDGHWVGLVEFKHVRREEPGAGEDKAPAVKLRLMHCEIAPEEHEGQVRELLQTMFKLRTAQGTLDDTEILERQVLPDTIKWAIDSLLWPPRPGDVWKAGDEPHFAFISDDGDVKLIDSTGTVHDYTEVLAKFQKLDLKARKPTKRGDDSA